MNPVSLYITTSRLVFQSGCGGIGDGGTGTDAVGTGGSGTISNSSAFADLNRLLPYLRKSLSCAVCCRLLIEPHTPAELNCQHHVCRGCVGERKKLKPSCASCKDYNRYVENTQLRMLLQCYKSICEYIKTKPFFAEIRRQATGVNGISVTVVGQSASMSGMGAGGGQQQQQQQQHQGTISVPSNLWELIEEGALFQDNYRCSSGLTKSAYSILPCIYPAPPVTMNVPSTPPTSATGPQQMIITSNSGGIQMQAKIIPATSGLESQPYTVSACPISILDKQHLHQQQQPNQTQIQQHQQLHHQQHQQQQQQQQQKEIKFRSAPIKTVSNGSTMYSVLYAGNGNKITIKRKTDPPHVQRRATLHTLDKDGQIKLAKTLAENSATIASFKMPPTATATPIPVITTSNANASKQTAKQLLKRRGCRCGNATATPGKLTCCGQRCPCYVESKSCIDCKCRGCRNPHRADGMKVRPHIPELQNIEINLHNATASESLSTATTTVLASQVTAGGSGSGGGLATIASINSQPHGSGLSGATSLTHYGIPGTAPGSTLKITPTSIANVLTGGGDGMELGPSGGLLDSNGFSYLTPAAASLDSSSMLSGPTVSGGTTTQYTVPGSSLTNGGTIHVVGVYTTHLGDVSCSPTLSNMIRTDSGLSSLLTHKPPDALLTQTSLNTLNLGTPTTLLGHSLFNPTTTTTMTVASGLSGVSGGSGGGGGGGLVDHSTANSSMDLTGMSDGSGIDISDQLDLGGANLITIDGPLDDRLHGDDV
ncbi:homeotic protein female sterile [Topomyia yanbarensis]|uniref:homeotic protein female sterile n=1 Tax=Topomyia yanbarensis TaxID=2498891 RepID=UPI00273C2425|nr:homeotic protein female sterile [Topomyia yanbarensis]